MRGTDEAYAFYTQTKLTTKFKKGSNTYDQSSILSSCSRFQNTASLRCSPESRRTCFSCRLGDVGILKMSFFEGRLRHHVHGTSTIHRGNNSNSFSKKTVTKTVPTRTFCCYYYCCCYKQQQQILPKNSDRFTSLAHPNIAGSTPIKCLMALENDFMVLFMVVFMSFLAQKNI